jgi:hypothetical protein
MSRISTSPAILFLLAGLSAGCHDYKEPSAPSAVPPAASASAPEPIPPALTVSGVVHEHTASGPRPLPQLSFTVRLTDAGWGDRGGGTLVTSDASGRYSVRSDEGTIVTMVLPAESGYHAPCPSGIDVLTADATMDIHVVADATLTTTGVPSSLPVSGPLVSGGVLERSTDGQQPVSGATIDLFTDASGVVKGTTLTDRRGAFLLCANPPGTSAVQTVWVGARKDGYRQTIQQVVLGNQDHVTLELARQ